MNSFSLYTLLPRERVPVDVPLHSEVLRSVLVIESDTYTVDPLQLFTQVLGSCIQVFYNVPIPFLGWP